MALAVRATAQDLWEARLEPVMVTAMGIARATVTAKEMEMTKEMEMETGTVTATERATVSPWQENDSGSNQINGRSFPGF